MNAVFALFSIAISCVAAPVIGVAAAAFWDYMGTAFWFSTSMGVIVGFCGFIYTFGKMREFFKF